MPWPCAKTVVFTAPTLFVPAGLDRDGLEQFRVLLEQRMLEATAEAEKRANQALGIGD
jgi:hypothetical protein